MFFSFNHCLINNCFILFQTAKNVTSAAIPALPAGAVALSESKEKREEKEIEDHVVEDAGNGKHLEPEVKNKPDVNNKPEVKTAARTEPVAAFTKEKAAAKVEVNAEKDLSTKAEEKKAAVVTAVAEEKKASATAVVTNDDLKVKEN